MNSSSIYIEIGQTTLHALKGDDALELPLERGLDGRLSESCRSQASSSLRGFLQKKNWQPRMNAYCAIGARGVTVRRISLPAAAKGDFQNLLALQIEAEFPLSPNELAWGYQALASTEERQEVVVAAVKKEMLSDYAELLTAAGLTPVFTVAAFARGCAVPQASASYSVLEIGRCQSELTTFEQGIPVLVRVLPWGGESITQAIAKKLILTAQQAEKLKTDFDGAAPETNPALYSAIGNALEGLTGYIDPKTVGLTLYLTGKSARYKDIDTRLARQLRNDIHCARIEPFVGPARSTAILGLRQWQEKSIAPGPIVLQLQEVRAAAEIKAQPELLKRALLAALLVCGLFALPYLEALVKKPHLVKHLTALKAETNRLSVINREVGFLQYLKKAQPPYLDAVYVIANSTPGGVRMDSINMSRRGECALRFSMQNGTQVSEFRSKLMSSGIFSTITVEEQAPAPDGQKVNVRMSAQWKPETTLEILAAADEKARQGDKTNAVAAASGGGPKPTENDPRKSTRN